MYDLEWLDTWPLPDISIDPIYGFTIFEWASVTRFHEQAPH